MRPANQDDFHNAADAATRPCRVALAFNLKRVPLTADDAEAEYDPPATIDIIADSIQSLGHTAVRVEATRDFPLKLAETHADVVFNVAESAGGRGREAHVPAVCEMMGIACTASDSTTLAVALDKALTKAVLAQHDIPTPPFRLIRSPAELRDVNLDYPVIVKPNHEGSSMGLRPDCVVQSPEHLCPVVERTIRHYAQPAIVEQCLPGREFTVGFIGQGEPEALPILELQFLDHTRPPVYDIDLKQDPPDKIRHVCPAPLDETLAAQIIDVARRAYHALSCRDVGRVDVRLDREGRPNVLEVNPLPGLAPRYSDICKMTEALGWPHTKLISRILGPALERRETMRRNLSVPSKSPCPSTV